MTRATVVGLGIGCLFPKASSTRISPISTRSRSRPEGREVPLAAVALRAYAQPLVVMLAHLAFG
ncbi:hypothetical protein Nhal_0773 [Nitrosococcus halophilus Nc 4]|uniref:Uncharacterized protein n=1 Tax=Nitrosococcus halophilus (strain Nc4) TaxID=472759 RepID=D5BXJ5_NITHN|nr:hypothetical protein [Nitrosococcus halophilus]ADE13953.1 hypothetical protein Nhal_0773 [Nitrosococcus halophilus Nc 4]